MQAAVSGKYFLEKGTFCDGVDFAVRLFTKSKNLKKVR